MLFILTFVLIPIAIIIMYVVAWKKIDNFNMKGLGLWMLTYTLVSTIMLTLWNFLFHLGAFDVAKN